jgi:N-acetyl-anhydromuramyl-L-alanine amidase AmpD
MVERPTIVEKPRSKNCGGYAGQRRVEAVVWHITQGTSPGSRGWLCNPASQASANYLIERDGTIYELVPPEEAAWANGQVNSPNTANPLIAGWLREGVNFNQRTVSIEHEGMTSNNHGGSLTPAQVRSTVHLTAWLCARFGLPPDQAHILGHYEIDDVNRHYCPGFSAAEWTAWVDQVAALLATGTTTIPAVGPEEGGWHCGETDKSVVGPFLSFWKTNGGLRLFGFPVSDEYTDAELGLNVQYFERARFERRPNGADVRLGRVGAELAKARAIPGAV